MAELTPGEVLADDPVVWVDTDLGIIRLESGETVELCEHQELRPGRYAYMAGPTLQGRWIVGEYELPEEDTRS